MPTAEERLQRGLYWLFFERDVLRGGRRLGPLRRWHLGRLARLLERKEAGGLEAVPEVEGCGDREVYEEYVLPRRPVVLRKAALHWPAVGKWSFPYFREVYGEEEIAIGTDKVERSRETTSYRIGFETLSFREFADRVDAGEALYLKFTPILERFPELREDLDLAQLSRWRQRSLEEPGTGQEFYMGGAGSRTDLHAELSDIFHVCVTGRKRWRFFAPENFLYLYPIPARTSFVGSEVDAFRPDETVHPWARCARGFEAVLEEGDVLYLPPFTWHAVENPEPAISVNDLSHRHARSLRALPLPYLNSRLLVDRRRGTAQQFLDSYASMRLPSLHGPA